MLKRILLGTFLVLSLSMGAHQVSALELTTGLSDAGGADGAGYNTEQDLAVTIGLIIKVAIGFLGVIFLVLTVYAGFTWMTAAGDTKKVEKAKGILVTSVIGLIIVLTSYTITTFVIGNIDVVAEGNVPGV